MKRKKELPSVQAQRKMDVKISPASFIQSTVGRVYILSGWMNESAATSTPSYPSMSGLKEALSTNHLYYYYYYPSTHSTLLTLITSKYIIFILHYSYKFIASVHNIISSYIYISLIKHTPMMFFPLIMTIWIICFKICFFPEIWQS